MHGTPEPLLILAPLHLPISAARVLAHLSAAAQCPAHFLLQTQSLDRAVLVGDRYLSLLYSTVTSLLPPSTRWQAL